MKDYGGDESVVLLHYPETFAQGGFVILGGHTFSEVVAQRFEQLQVAHLTAFSFFHATDAPVEIG